MNFAQALEHMEKGGMVRRKSWDYYRSFIFQQVPSVINKSVVPKMTSLPDSVKKEFERRFNDPRMQVSELYYADQLAEVNPSNLITGYSPSVSDCFANDWIIVE